MSSTVDHEIELRLHEEIAQARGTARAAIVRKEKGKELKKLRRKQRETAEANVLEPAAGKSPHGKKSSARKEVPARSGWGNPEHAEILCEVTLNGAGVQVSDFVPMDIGAPVGSNSDEEEDAGGHQLLETSSKRDKGSLQLWPRLGTTEQFLELLSRPECPLSRRVVVWEPLDLDSVDDETRLRAQRRVMREERRVTRAGVAGSETLAGADEGASGAAELEPHATDPGAFRDLPLLAERMDRFANVETTFKLASSKVQSQSLPTPSICFVFFVTNR
jgi:hypothetical protein